MKAKQIRSRAKAALKGRYWWCVLAALLAWVFGVVSLGASSSASSQAKDVAEKAKEALNGLPAGVGITITILTITIVLVSIAMSVVSGSVKLGYARFNMQLFAEGEKPSMNLMFSRMAIIWKALWLQIVKAVLVALGTVLLIIPGIIIGLSLSQSEYILAENPELSAGEVLRRSREMMKGNKWRFFCLMLSFIGWNILAGIVPAGPLLLTPYIEASEAAFYLDMNRRLEDNQGAGVESAA